MKKTIIAILLAATSISSFAANVTTNATITGTVVSVRHLNVGGDWCDNTAGCVQAGAESPKIPLRKNEQVEEISVSSLAQTQQEPYSKKANKEIELASHDFKTGSRDFTLQVASAPDNYSPFVLSFAAESLIKDGKFEEGLFLRHLAILHAGFDRSITKFESDREIFGLLMMMSSPAQKDYSTRNIDFLEKVAKKVVAWDEVHKPNYERRWAASLPGKSGQETVVPEDRWPDLIVMARKEYLASITKAVFHMKALDAICPIKKLSEAEYEKCGKTEKAIKAIMGE